MQSCCLSWPLQFVLPTFFAFAVCPATSLHPCSLSCNLTSTIMVTTPDLTAPLTPLACLLAYLPICLLACPPACLPACLPAHFTYITCLPACTGGGNLSGRRLSGSLRKPAFLNPLGPVTGTGSGGGSGGGAGGGQSDGTMVDDTSGTGHGSGGSSVEGKDKEPLTAGGNGAVPAGAGAGAGVGMVARGMAGKVVPVDDRLSPRAAVTGVEAGDSPGTARYQLPTHSHRHTHIHTYTQPPHGPI